MPSRFSHWEYPQIDEGILTKYHWVVQNKEHLSLGYKTDIGAFSYINAKNGVIIEDFVQLGSHCSVYSTSSIDNKDGKVHLKKNCRIGTHSAIMPCVTIGENSIIGAFSLVNSDIPDNVLAYGIPARVIRKLTYEEHAIPDNMAD
jgi:acetyltransferase-like isoleucine patch superfamily enzyme